MKNYFEEIKKGLAGIVITDQKGTLLPDNAGMNHWIERAKTVSDVNGTIFLCGNGASATMAEHISHDCFQNMKVNTYTCSEVAHITAISNDLSYEDVFAYRIGRIGTDKDMLIAISASGNSPNIVKAVKTAHAKGMFVITLSGKGKDNKIRSMGDLNCYVPLYTYGMVESAHAVILHAWLDLYMDRYIDGGRH